MSTWLRRSVFSMYLVVVLLAGRPGRAEGIETDEKMNALIVLICLSATGIPALVLDTTSASFIAAGPSPSASRLVVGAVSIFDGMLLVSLGVVAAVVPMSSEQRTLQVTLGMAMGASTIGLGVGSVLRYKPLARVSLAPLVLDDGRGGTGLGVAFGGVF